MIVTITHLIMFKVVLILGALALAAAECPNACSGNGECSIQDQCVCYPNYMGADCSERVCPFGMAFVDTPNGDLNHDGDMEDTQVPTLLNNAAFFEGYPGGGVYNPAADEAHYYKECSGKGMCDRVNGECACFDGYTGSSCQRSK